MGHLASAIGTGVSATYAYDTADERFAATVNGQTTYSIRQGAQTLSEYTASCAAPIWTRDLIYAGGQLLGAVKAAIWQNQSENGTRYNVTLSRIYKDGEQWKTTESFGRDDLLLLAKVIDQAHSWIFQQGK